MSLLEDLIDNDGFTMEQKALLRDIILQLCRGDYQDPACVVLARTQLPTKFYSAAIDSNASRFTALEAALEEAATTPSVASVIHLCQGRFAVPAGVSLSDISLTANVVLTFGEGASLKYENPEDACDDCELFVGVRNIIHFGADSTDEGDSPIDCTGPIQAAWNSLPLYPDGTNVYLLESGRKMRSGHVYAPIGTFWLGGPVFYSPTTRFTGAAFRGTIFKVMNGAADGAGEEVFFFRQDLAVAPVSPNNLFGTHFENFSLVCPRPDLNSRASGWLIAGGQGTGGKGVVVAFFALRNLVNYGGSFIGCWFSDAIRGPNVDSTAGAYFDVLSAEHANRLAVVDTAGTKDALGTLQPATHRVFPSVRFRNGHYSARFIQGEEVPLAIFPAVTPIGANAQTVLECINVMSCVVGSMAMGVNNDGSVRTHTMLRVAGTSENVSVGRLSGTHTGFFPIDVGLLVYDDSTFSPAGSGVPYTLTAIRGSYSQQSGGFVPGLDLDNAFVGDNSFTGNTLLGNPANNTDGLVVRNLVGNTTILAGYYETDRPTSYFSFEGPKPHDWNAGAMTLTANGTLNLAISLKIAGLDAVRARETGWTAMAGTATKGGFDTATVTLPQLAQVVKALVDAGIYHGGIGT